MYIWACLQMLWVGNSSPNTHLKIWFAKRRSHLNMLAMYTNYFPRMADLIWSSSPTITKPTVGTSIKYFKKVSFQKLSEKSNFCCIDLYWFIVAFRFDRHTCLGFNWQMQTIQNMSYVIFYWNAPMESSV